MSKKETREIYVWTRIFINSKFHKQQPKTNNHKGFKSNVCLLTCPPKSLAVAYEIEEVNLPNPIIPTPGERKTTLLNEQGFIGNLMEELVMITTNEQLCLPKALIPLPYITTKIEIRNPLRNSLIPLPEDERLTIPVTETQPTASIITIAELTDARTAAHSAGIHPTAEKSSDIANESTAASSAAHSTGMQLTVENSSDIDTETTAESSAAHHATLPIVPTAAPTLRRSNRLKPNIGAYKSS